MTDRQFAPVFVAVVALCAWLSHLGQNAGIREVWREAEEAAKADNVSLSDLTATALREHLNRRRRRTTAKQGDKA